MMGKKESQRLWRLSHPNYMKEWRLKNKERLKQLNKDWVEKNRDRVREYQKSYYKSVKWRMYFNAYMKEYNKKKRLEAKLCKCYANAATLSKRLQETTTSAQNA